MAWHPSDVKWGRLYLAFARPLWLRGGGDERHRARTDEEVPGICCHSHVSSVHIVSLEFENLSVFGQILKKAFSSLRFTVLLLQKLNDIERVYCKSESLKAGLKMSMIPQKVAGRGLEVAAANQEASLT